MKKILAFTFIMILCLLCLCSCNNGGSGKETYGEKFTAGTGIDTEGHKLHHVEITVKNYGIITLTLDETIAPITVKNFVKLANEGFYDGLTFHRIMEGFMMQGGDPEGNGLGGNVDKNGKKVTIKGEFAENGVKNDISHVRGVISMARGGNSYDSASSQFFIVHEDSIFLDKKYAAFGHVISGIEVVDKVCADAKPTDDNGTIKKADQPIIESIVIRTE